ncbi:MAG: hypothetical protein LH473_13280, partial [Chitinophagales bacterium]|nr:hypothetical protein [Chitinophagales bacterium]
MASQNLIFNPGFEDGSQTADLKGIAEGYADYWDINPSPLYPCITPGNVNTPDLLDKTVSCNTYTGCNQSGNACVGVPWSFISEGDIDIRPGGIGNRYTHMIPGEHMDVDLSTPVTNKIYYLNFWSSPASCTYAYFSALCMMLVNTTLATNNSVGTIVFNDGYYPPLPGEWNNYGRCIDLTNVSPSGFNKISFSFVDGDQAAYDDFQLALLADAGNDYAYCNSGSVVLGPPVSGIIEGANYQWSPATGLSCTNCPNPVCTVTTTTTYTLTVTSPDGLCTATDQVTVTACVNAIPEIIGDAYACDATSQYSVSNTYAPGTSFNWSFTGSGSISATGLVTWKGQNPSGTVCVTATPPAGCPCPPTTNCFEVKVCCQGDPNILSGNKVIVQNITATAFEALLISLVNGADLLPFDSAIPNYVINGSNNTSHEFVINGTLTIDHDFTFTNIPNFNFGPDAQIYNPGYHLTITNSTLKAGCEEMWIGINCHTSNHTTIIDQCTINDATEALYFYDRHVIRVINSTFDKNLVDIIVRDYSGNPVAYPAAIYGNAFKCSATLKSPYLNEKTWFGIKVFGSSGDFPIGILAQPNNIFDLGLHVGVYGNASSINITKENIFQNIKNDIPTTYLLLKGYAVYCIGSGNNILTQSGWGNATNSTINFNTCTYGIYLNGMNCMIQNNFMAPVNFGISAFSCNGKKIDILNNRINNDITGINLGISNAIEINNCIGATINVYANFLRVCLNSTYNSSSTGIEYVDNNTLNDPIFNNNSISVHYAGRG